MLVSANNVALLMLTGPLIQIADVTGYRPTTSIGATFEIGIEVTRILCEQDICKTQAMVTDVIATSRDTDPPLKPVPCISAL